MILWISNRLLKVRSRGCSPISHSDVTAHRIPDQMVAPSNEISFRVMPAPPNGQVLPNIGKYSSSSYSSTCTFVTLQFIRAATQQCVEREFFPVIMAVQGSMTIFVDFDIYR